MDDDDLEPRRTKGGEFPRNLERLSIEDMDAYVAELEAEIRRVEAEIERRRRVKSGADEVFKKG